jgi:hypothetical protein
MLKLYCFQLGKLHIRYDYSWFRVVWFLASCTSSFTPTCRQGINGKFSAADWGGWAASPAGGGWCQRDEWHRSIGEVECRWEQSDGRRWRRTWQTPGGRTDRSDGRPTVSRGTQPVGSRIEQVSRGVGRSYQKSSRHEAHYLTLPWAPCTW